MVVDLFEVASQLDFDEALKRVVLSNAPSNSPTAHFNPHNKKLESKFSGKVRKVGLVIGLP